ncbi:MAG TPA: hypothetical protein PKC68_06010 [Alphaproteobacteria bacterium]|nr:hypothetical protein [Alphaproteobacteria bacterium]
MTPTELIEQIKKLAEHSDSLSNGLVKIAGQAQQIIWHQGASGLDHGQQLVVALTVFVLACYACATFTTYGCYQCCIVSYYCWSLTGS